MLCESRQRCDTSLTPLGMQVETLKLLISLVYDDNLEIRLASINLLGRLVPRNPAFVMTTLRNLLIQLLESLSVSESHEAEEINAILLGMLFVVSNHISVFILNHHSGALIKNAPQIVAPYTVPILEALRSKVCRIF